MRHQLFQRHVTAPSVTSEHASETGKPQQDSGPLGCHLVGRAAAVWHLRTRQKQRWTGDRKLWQAAGIGWADVTALSSTVPQQPFQRHVTAASVTGEDASETGKPQQDSGPRGCHLVGGARCSLAPSNALKAKMDGWGRKLWQAGEHASETGKPQQDSR